MSDDQKDVEVAQDAPDMVEGTEAGEVPSFVKAEPIESRFLFVDVAAQRAKQLRRGARPRLSAAELPHKLERLAMREVQAELVEWDLPAFKGAGVVERPS